MTPKHQARNFFQEILSQDYMYQNEVLNELKALMITDRKHKAEIAQQRAKETLDSITAITTI